MENHVETTIGFRACGLGAWVLGLVEGLGLRGFASGFRV